MIERKLSKEVSNLLEQQPEPDAYRAQVPAELRVTPRVMVRFTFEAPAQERTLSVGAPGFDVTRAPSTVTR